MLERSSTASAKSLSDSAVVLSDRGETRPAESTLDAVDGDEALVVRSSKGDREAFEELIRRTGRLVYSQVMLKVGDPHLAEDLTQETFLNAYRSISTMYEPKGFRSWLVKIAHSVVIDHARRSQRKKRAGTHTSTDLIDAPDKSPGPSEEIETNEARERALKLLQNLPEDYRLPLTMRYLGNADYETIRRQLGISNGSLRGLLNRGMALLRAEFEKRRAVE